LCSILCSVFIPTACNTLTALKYYIHSCYYIYNAFTFMLLYLVGCCSLRVEHLKLLPDDELEFDFLGKDSIRYYNKVGVWPQRVPMGPRSWLAIHCTCCVCCLFLTDYVLLAHTVCLLASVRCCL
jgi:hypothetical protein